MRFWRRSEPEPVPSSEDPFGLEASLRGALDGLFLLQDRQILGRSVTFAGQLLIEPRRALPLLRERMRPFGYTPFLRGTQEAARIQLLPLAEVEVKTNLPLHLGLFFATVFTTLLAGALMEGVDPLAHPLGLVAGVPFSFTLLAILGTHEFGHYFAARHHGMAVTLPYFIPAPPPFPAGTLGAVIRMKSPARDRDALFDVAVAGPLAGLVLAIPALLIGLSLSRVVPVPATGSTIYLGSSLLTRFLEWVVVGPLPPGSDIFIHPVGLAGWFGLFVTALNLFPAGQLDGGHIAYALFGRFHRRVSQLTILLLGLLGFLSLNWLVWAMLLLVLMGIRHSPPLDDITPLDPRRRWLGYFALLLLILTLPPVPLTIQ